MRYLTPLVWLVILFLLLTGVAGAMFYARSQILQEFDKPERQSEWNEWRESVRRGETNHVGPVKRKVPRSTEPPTLVLMRDYFYTCLTGLWVICSVLFATIVFFVQGVLSPRTRGKAIGGLDVRK